MGRIYRRPDIGDDDYLLEDWGYETPCWIWRGAVNNKGYGKVVIAGKRQYAHRAMYEQEVEAIPEGLTIDHLCRQRNCVNPAHLEPTTMAANLQRGKGAKLTSEQVLEIRREPSTTTTRVLAARYEISESHMSRVRRRLRWK